MKIGKIIILMVIILTSCRSDQTSVDYDSYSADKSAIVGHNLIAPAVAYELLTEQPDIYFPIQVSKEKPFLKEHIPNAQNIWRPDYASANIQPYAGLIPSKLELENLLQSLGFVDGKTMLLYDIKANVDALRFAWVLNLYGFDNYKIINGGLKYWKINDLPISNEVAPEITKSDYQLPNSFDSSIIANFDEVLAAIEDENTLLIDTREDYEYLGHPFVFKGTILPYKKGAFNRGSIPSAIHLNWSTLADLSEDHRIKSEKDMRYDLAQKGITPDKNIILYCHSGSRTSHTFYVLKHVLNYKNVKNYDGSWIEWSYKHSVNNEIPINQIASQKEFEFLKDSLIKNLN